MHKQKEAHRPDKKLLSFRKAEELESKWPPSNLQITTTKILGHSLRKSPER
jgi:hypothetical protein